MVINPKTKPRKREILRRIESDYWWHVNKRRLVYTLLYKYSRTSERILEIGCGGGTNSKLLAKKGHWVVVTTSFLGGINLLGIGVLGEYIARIYDEIKRRPIYIIEKIVGHVIKVVLSFPYTLLNLRQNETFNV